MTRTFRLLSFLSLALLLGSCYPSGPQYITDLDVVATRQHANYDYKQLKTYFMRDTVVKITDSSDASRDKITITPGMQTAILGSIKTNMASYGYARITDTTVTKPDVYMQVSVLENTYLYAYYDYWYYYWGWYPYYPYYPYYPTISYSEYTFGTLIIQMLQPSKQEPDDNRVPITPWLAAMNGLLANYGQLDAQSRVTGAIDQAFRQSTYLDTK